MIIRVLLVLILSLGSASLVLQRPLRWGRKMIGPLMRTLTVPVWPTTSYRLPIRRLVLRWLQNRPIQRLLKEVREGALMGVFNVPKESANEKDYIFGSTPLFVAHSAYYYNKDHPLSARKKEDLVNGRKNRYCL